MSLHLLPLKLRKVSNITTDKYEIINIISFLDLNKSTGPNNIPTKILKLLKNGISAQLSDIFNVSLSIGDFPSILKLQRLFLFIKNNPNWFTPIAVQSHSYPILKKY